MEKVRLFALPFPSWSRSRDVYLNHLLVPSYHNVVDMFVVVVAPPGSLSLSTSLSLVSLACSILSVDESFP